MASRSNTICCRRFPAFFLILHVHKVHGHDASPHQTKRKRKGIRLDEREAMTMRLRGNARLVCALLLVLLCVASRIQGGASRGGGGGRGGRIGGGGSSDGGSTGGGGSAVPGAGGGGGSSYMRGAGGGYVPTRGYGGRNTTATGSNGRRAAGEPRGRVVWFSAAAAALVALSILTQA
ncbi:acanthoscurrin-1-like [Triticum dicoccoides]|nr:acanthoscurrin-1-like [Triticum dicoccoides]